MRNDILNDIIQQVRYHLVSLKRNGTSSVFFEEYRNDGAQTVPFILENPLSQTENTCSVSSLEELALSVHNCSRCEELVKNRTHVVFGSGNKHSRLMFIGEAPGHDEDIQGLPFVGNAGRLLTKMLAAIGLSREEVYIANVIKCRPPENRNPLPDEVQNCAEFLHQQIEYINPEIICTLGSVATRNLLQTETPITQLHGQRLNWHGIPVLPTFHPSYLLRSPHMKKEAWRDLITLMRIISEQAIVV
ncbi:MAG: uracil-DNA glycosylase [Candidatus Auribacter fodinae]|jgi:DNA polymerase|uniref:Type-4 uracil-DNA glycosylase n=1 Tax=Candidatus Auribacter fodinae TaxID=2093366 RepID=A0A3A4QUE2_9BACT|nr:MAG: uracil-DNA glycosylase [Candidatus Auribacter fodinae]